MLMSAFAAAMTSLFTGSAWLGVLGGMLLGGFVGLFHAFLCIRFRANQTVVGMGINIFAMGITPMLLQAYWGNPGSTPSVPGLPAISIPLLKEIPVLGAILGTHSPLTYLALILVPVTWFVLFRTKFGLRGSFNWRAPQSCRHFRRQCLPHAVFFSSDLRSVGWAWRCVSIFVPGFYVCQGNDIRPRIHGDGCHDLWQVEPCWWCF